MPVIIRWDLGTIIHMTLSSNGNVVTAASWIPDTTQANNGHVIEMVEQRRNLGSKGNEPLQDDNNKIVINRT